MAKSLAVPNFHARFYQVPPERTPHVEVWLQHESMKNIENTLPPPPQPGINGLRYSAKRQHVNKHSTETVHARSSGPETYEAIGTPQRLASGGMYDDFCIADENGAAYLTVHRENRIDCAAIEPDGEAAHPIAGKSPDEILLGPTSATCGRMPGEYGRVAYATRTAD